MTKADFKKTGAFDGKRIAAKVISVALSVAALALTFIFLNNADKAARDTVDIVRIKKPTPAYTFIDSSYVEKYPLIKKEYDKNNMVLFSDFDELVHGKYSAYFLRESTILYRDQLIEARLPRNLWIYGLSEDEEVLTIVYNYLEAGGDILLPGDTIRVRVSYEADIEPDTDYDPYDAYGAKASGSRATKKSTRTDILFDSITVKDMINSNGQSVFEVYSEVMRLDEKQRQDAMKTKEFQSSVKPRSLLLAGTKQDMDRYANFKAQVGSGNFLITILSRSGRVGLDNLPTLETEVRTWIDRGK